MEDIQNIPEPIRIFKGDIDTEGLLILPCPHAFLKCINDNFFSQHVDEPTSGKNLDFVFTSSYA